MGRNTSFPRQEPNDGHTCGMCVADVTISSAELLALNATPKTLVAAPGAGKMLIFEGALTHKPAGTAYAGIAAGEDFSIKYTDGSGVEVGVAETTGFLDQATAQSRYIRPIDKRDITLGTNAGAPSSFTPVANAALVAQHLAGEITTGDSALYLRVFYRIVPATLPA